MMLYICPLHHSTAVLELDQILPCSSALLVTRYSQNKNYKYDVTLTGKTLIRQLW